ncbi:MAG TPA: hypothetical protein VJ850_02670 [Candidatus Limnocylindrales bacterium]|nr:hypothetical protein [Candidatus Limnocylindrales bacterium]
MRPKRVGVYLAAALLALVALSQGLAKPGATTGELVGEFLGVILIFVIARWIARRWDAVDGD